MSNLKKDGYKHGPEDNLQEDMLPAGLINRPDVVTNITAKEREEARQNASRDHSDKVKRVTGLATDGDDHWMPQLDKDDDVDFDVNDDLWIFKFSELGLY